MATTIGSLSSSTANSIRGYGGLASGLDRDTLIEGMTYGTTSKITKRQQQKTQLEWKQSAVQSITNLMLSFANKYTSSFSSATNLFSSVFWGRSNITTTGANSKYVSVSGSAKSADAVTIMGVKQLAEKAKWSSEAVSNNRALETGAIKPGESQTSEELIGKSLVFNYGGTTYTVFLHSEDADGNELKYDTAEHAAASINKMLSEEKVGSKTLADYFKVGLTDDGKNFTISKGEDTNSRSLTGGTALALMGIDDPGEGGKEITDEDSVVGTKGTGAITREISFAEQIAGKSLTFTYNGVTKSIRIADQATLEEGVNKDSDGNPATKEDRKKIMENLTKSLQQELDSAFGKGRVQVNQVDSRGKVTPNGMRLSFQTMNVTTGEVDKTATLTLNYGSTGLLGTDGALSMKSGATNKLDLSKSITDLGFTEGLDFETITVKDKDGNPVKDENDKDVTRERAFITINGEKIEVYKDDTVNSLMARINSNKKAGVEVSYQAATDKFTFTSTENGASGTIKFGADNDAIGNQLLENIFGAKAGDEVRGQDAIVTVKYAGSDEEVDLYRDSNNFTVDGLTISVKGEFGYKTEQAKDENGTLKVDDNGDPIMEKVRDYDSEAVKINAEVNADSIVEAIKSMVEEYNAIIEKVNKELTTKPDRSYSPLTSEQKKELSEDEIKLYEDKAKEGLLFGDSDLRSLSSDLRFIISGGNMQALEKIGISTSSSYSDNGKLSLDESKLRAALASDPEAVEKLFTGTASTDANGKAVSYDGLATNLKKVMDKYVETLGSWESKGILIRKAGSESSPVSITENYMYKQIAEYNKQIANLQARLESERDRYIKQFTSLETLISQMNSQSSWLAQIGGSY